MNKEDLLNKKIVHSTSDSYGNIIVFDNKHYRVLSFDTVYEQSGFFLEKPHTLVFEYTRMMMLVLGFVDPKHITLLGLGGGSLHYYLSKCQFHVVELRLKVYQIAKEYFQLPDDERILVSIDDAELRCKKMKDASTDIIFADMYDAHAMRPVQAQSKFIRECWRILSKSGWLVINYHHMPDLDSPFFENLNDYFSTIMFCSSDSGCDILFASKAAKVDHDLASIKLQKMEEILGERFMPLFERLVDLS